MQNNALIKGEGGAVGLMDNPDAQARWTIAGSEISHIVNEFDDAVNTNGENYHGEFCHHSQSPTLQSTFQDGVKCLIHVLEEWCSPFINKWKELYVLYVMVSK